MAKKALVVQSTPSPSPLRRLANTVVRKNLDFAVTAAVVGVALAVDAQAELTLTGVTLNTEDVESIMMLVIPALAALWGFRKIVKTMNRS